MNDTTNAQTSETAAGAPAGVRPPRPTASP